MMMMKKEKVGERHEKKPLGKEKKGEQGTAVFSLYSFTHVLPDDCEASEVGILGPIFVVAG